MAVSKCGDTSLHLAALYGRTSVAKLLLLHGSDIEAITYGGMTPLLEAVSSGPTTVLLLEQGANINATTNAGDSVLHLAAFTRDLGCFELLVDNGAQIDKKNIRRRTPFPLEFCDASAQGKQFRQVHLVKFLLSRGAEVNAKPQGRTVLYEQVATWGHRPTIEALLKAGADVNVRAIDGSTVLHLTARRWYADLGKLFINAGADCEAKTYYGETVLDIVLKRGWEAKHYQAQFLALLKPGMG
ncbi:hypothetical protein MMC26_007559 [Xylographa opegraphella]|nr:hypothetical protein [Xylographa opegraphella]